jgi:ATP-dependent RNA helicase DeaD
MSRFRSSAIEFLVATDVAARGIDVENVEVVFNYDLPWDEEDYVHRIGRTGRAGRSGRALSLIAGREIYKLQGIERYTRMKIPRQQVPSLEEVEEKRTNLFFERIRTALQKGQFQTETPVVDRLLEQGFSATDIACALVHELRKEDAPLGEDSSAKRREDRADSRPAQRHSRYRGSRQKRR